MMHAAANLIAATISLVVYGGAVTSLADMARIAMENALGGVLSKRAMSSIPATIGSAMRALHIREDSLYYPQRMLYRGSFMGLGPASQNVSSRRIMASHATFWDMF